MSAMDSQPVSGTFFTHHAFHVSGVAFDSLHVQGSGPTDNGAFFAVIDSVHIGSMTGTVFCDLAGLRELALAHRRRPPGRPSTCRS